MATYWRYRYVNETYGYAYYSEAYVSLERLNQDYKEGVLEYRTVTETPWEDYLIDEEG